MCAETVKGKIYTWVNAMNWYVHAYEHVSVVVKNVIMVVCVYAWTHHSSLVEVLSPHTILYIMAKYSLLSRCFSSSVILFCSFSFSVYNYTCNRHLKYSDTWKDIQIKSQGAIFQRKIASLSGIQTHDLQHSRLKLYQLSYNSYKAA